MPCPFLIDDFEVSRSLLLSLKKGEPPLRSDVMAPLAEMPVLLPEDPKGFW